MTFPKVKIEHSAHGKGRLLVDGVEPRNVTHLCVDVDGGGHTRVSFSLIADVDLEAAEANVEMLIDETPYVGA